MYESFIIITDVGAEPDYRGEWPKLGIAHIVHVQNFGSVVLGRMTYQMIEYDGRFESQETAIIDQYSYEGVKCAVQYFNDGPSVRFPPSLGTIGYLDVKSLYGEVPPVQLCCDDIPKAMFGTYLAFDTLPEIKFIPLEE